MVHIRIGTANSIAELWVESKYVLIVIGFKHQCANPDSSSLTPAVAESYSKPDQIFVILFLCSPHVDQ